MILNDSSNGSYIHQNYDRSNGIRPLFDHSLPRDHQRLTTTHHSGHMIGHMACLVIRMTMKNNCTQIKRT